MDALSRGKIRDAYLPQYQAQPGYSKLNPTEQTQAITRFNSLFGLSDPAVGEPPPIQTVSGQAGRRLRETTEALVKIEARTFVDEFARQRKVEEQLTAIEENNRRMAKEFPALAASQRRQVALDRQQKLVSDLRISEEKKFERLMFPIKLVDEIGKGLAQSKAKFTSSGLWLAALVADSVDPELAERLAVDAMRGEIRAQKEFGAEVERWEDAKKSGSNFAYWFTAKIAQQGVQIAGSVITGAAGARVGGALLGNLGKLIGFNLGVGVPTFVQEAGSTYGEIVQRTGSLDEGKIESLVSATGAAALEVGLLGRLFRLAGARAVSRAVGRGISTAATKKAADAMLSRAQAKLTQHLLTDPVYVTYLKGVVSQGRVGGFVAGTQ